MFSVNIVRRKSTDFKFIQPYLIQGGQIMPTTVLRAPWIFRPYNGLAILAKICFSPVLSTMKMVKLFVTLVTWIWLFSSKKILGFTWK